MHRILIAEPRDFSPEAVRMLQSAGTVDLREIETSDLANAFGQYDVVWIRLGHRVTAELLGADLRTRILCVPTTGLDHIDLEACQRSKVRVLSLKGETEFLRNVRGTAELAVALTLALFRRLVPFAESVKKGDWNRDAFRGNELLGKTVGIVGVGRLGTIVAGYFQVFGCEIIGYDPRPDFPSGAARRVESLGDLLSVADVVVVLVSYDSTTHGMFGAAELARMKQGAVLVNVSRGGVIDEGSLVISLTSGHLAGAALDVLADEPYITEAHPLIVYARSHGNLLITPHIGGNTVESLAKTELFLAEKAVRALSEMAVA